MESMDNFRYNSVSVKVHNKLLSNIQGPRNGTMTFHFSVLKIIVKIWIKKQFEI